jgi:hypothetical protein
VAAAWQRAADNSAAVLELIPVTVPELLRQLRGTVIPEPRRDRPHRDAWALGSLPRPEDLVALNAQRDAGGLASEAEFRDRLREAVSDVVARQRASGIDLVNDGEFGH